MNKGISLVELLIVIGIIVIMAVVLTPQLLGYYFKSQLTGDTAKIASTLRAARDKSITQEDATQWGVHFVNPSSGLDYYILFKGASYPGTDVKRINLNPNVIFASIPSGSSTDRIFSKMIGLPSSTSSIIISLTNDSNASSTISITSSGEIQY